MKQKHHLKLKALFREALLFSCFIQLAIGPTTVLAQSTPLSETILRGATQVVGTGMQIYDQQRMREMYYQHMQQTAGLSTGHRATKLSK